MIKKVPKATLRRYPIYLKALRERLSQGDKKISSFELSKMTNVKAATIRRDFTFISTHGRQGFGYDVAELIELFSSKLGKNFDTKIIMIGMGNLGKALSNYNAWEYGVGDIGCAFDIAPEQVFNSKIPVYHLDDLEEKIPTNCTVAILTGSKNLQNTVDRLILCGIKGIIDCTHQHFTVPDDIKVKYVDVVSMIQEIVFETNMTKN